MAFASLCKAAVRAIFASLDRVRDVSKTGWETLRRDHKRNAGREEDAAQAALLRMRTNAAMPCHAEHATMPCQHDNKFQPMPCHAMPTTSNKKHAMPCHAMSRQDRYTSHAMPCSCHAAQKQKEQQQKQDHACHAKTRCLPCHFMPCHAMPIRVPCHPNRQLTQAMHAMPTQAMPRHANTHKRRRAKTRSIQAMPCHAHAMLYKTTKRPTRTTRPCMPWQDKKSTNHAMQCFLACHAMPCLYRQRKPALPCHANRQKDTCRAMPLHRKTTHAMPRQE